MEKMDVSFKIQSNFTMYIFDVYYNVLSVDDKQRKELVEEMVRAELKRLDSAK